APQLNVIVSIPCSPPPPAAPPGPAQLFPLSRRCRGRGSAVVRVGRALPRGGRGRGPVPRLSFVDPGVAEVSGRPDTPQRRDQRGNVAVRRRTPRRPAACPAVSEGRERSGAPASRPRGQRCCGGYGACG